MSWSSQGAERGDPSGSYNPLDDLALLGPSRSRAASVVIVSLLAAASTMAVLVLGVGAKKRRVPPLVGASLERTRGLLVERGLALIVSRVRPDPLVTAGSVASQSPLARRQLGEGGAVIVELSSGPPRPNSSPAHITPRRAAPVPLRGKGLAGKGPAPKTASPVAAGAGQVVVPRVTGVKLRYARSRLRALGLTVGRLRYKTDEDHMSGMVLRQRPRAKARAARGSAVELTINRTD